MDKLRWWSDMIENKQLYEELQNKANNIKELEGWVIEMRQNLEYHDNGDNNREYSSHDAHLKYGMVRALVMVQEKMKELGLTPGE